MIGDPEYKIGPVAVRLRQLPVRRLRGKPLATALLLDPRPIRTTTLRSTMTARLGIGAFCSARLKFTVPSR